MNYSVPQGELQIRLIAISQGTLLAGNRFLRQNQEAVKILALSDEALERMYALASSGQLQDVELIIGCGDLPYPYLEYLMTVLNVPLVYVPGNHDPESDPRVAGTMVEGGSNLDLKMIRHHRYLIGGLGGSIRYRRDGTNQYSQGQACLRAACLLPSLLLNRIQYGRALDILISHSPPAGIHDADDPAHQGLVALNWLIRIAQPRYHFHGHIHSYRRNLESHETSIGITKVINVYPYRTIEVSH
jgi:hypothetical protein